VCDFSLKSLESPSPEQRGFGVSETLPPANCYNTRVRNLGLSKKKLLSLNVLLFNWFTVYHILVKSKMKEK
jgi:hypothetical protein